MSQTYSTPPIVEAFCQFNFVDDTEWNNTIFGLLYNRLQKNFPIVKDIKPSIILPGIKFAEERTRFYSEDEKDLVQVSPHMLSVHRLAPYTSWNHLFPIIEHVYNIYLEVARPNTIGRIGLRYINHVDLEELTPASLAKYLTIYPQVNPTVANQFRSFLTRIEIDYPESEDVLRVQSGTVTVDAEVTKVALDLDYVVHGSLTTDAPDILQRVNLAHERIEAAFENSITNDLRITFDREEK